MMTTAEAWFDLAEREFESIVDEDDAKAKAAVIAFLRRVQADARRAAYDNVVRCFDDMAKRRTAAAALDLHDGNPFASKLSHETAEEYRKSMRIVKELQAIDALAEEERTTTTTTTTTTGQA